MEKNRMFLIAAILGGVSIVGCDAGSGGIDESDVSADSDTDTDTGTDTDTNTDMHTDTNTEADGDVSLVIEEAEGFCAVDGSIDNDNAGFSGDGFANTDNATGTAIEWSVLASSATTVTIAWNYANGGGGSRPGQLVVNGSNQGRVDLPVTGDWSTWNTTQLSAVSLQAGENDIRLEAITADGLANINSLTVSGAGISAGSCVTGEADTGIDTDTDNDTDTHTELDTDTDTDTDTDPDTDTDSEGQCVIRITDVAPGWASMNGGTTGAGTDLNSAITVTTMSELQSAASGGNIVLVEPGTYDGSLKPESNTTIIGTAPGVLIEGYISVSGEDNVIIRNIALKGDPCSTYDECKDGKDGVYIGHGAKNVWFDHVDVMDGQDGNFDVTRRADFVTASWCKFHYTYDKEHRFSNLIAGGDNEIQSRGKLNITYMNSWWGERVSSRQPRGRFGKIHMLNCYHNNDGNLYGVGKEMSLIAENCHYEVPGNDVFRSSGGEHTGWQGIGNIGNADDMNDSEGTVFTIPYSYSAMPASEVEAAVTDPDSGAGNTCIFQP